VNYAPENAIPAAAISGPDADLLERLGQRYPSVRLRLNIATQTQTDSTSYNVIGEITGQDAKREIVMMSAHLNSWDLGTGAVDDGFGVAVTMAAGALIKQLPQAPRRTIRVVLFANEENGFDGARAYAARDAGDLSRHFWRSKAIGAQGQSTRCVIRRRTLSSRHGCHACWLRWASRSTVPLAHRDRIWASWPSVACRGSSSHRMPRTSSIIITAPMTRWTRSTPRP